jgi:hypothetical protein
MKALANAFLNEPVIVLGVVQGVAVVLAQEAVISGWIALAVVAAVLPFQRYFVTPK